MTISELLNQTDAEISAELSIGSLVQLVGPSGIWEIEGFKGRHVILKRISPNNPPLKETTDAD